MPEQALGGIPLGLGMVVGDMTFSILMQLLVRGWGVVVSLPALMYSMNFVFVVCRFVPVDTQNTWCFLAKGHDMLHCT